jgi:hypothetical protein
MTANALQPYELKETRLGKGRLRVVVSLPHQASTTERVFIAHRSYDRRALLWQAHNSINAKPRHRSRPAAPRMPEGVAYWRARLDHLAKRAGWEPYWEGDYIVPIGSEPSRFGHTAAVYCVIGCNGIGLVGRIHSTAPDTPHVGEALHTDKPAALARWLRANRIAYRDHGETPDSPTGRGGRLKSDQVRVRTPLGGHGRQVAT